MDRPTPIPCTLGMAPAAERKSSNASLLLASPDSVEGLVHIFGHGRS